MHLFHRPSSSTLSCLFTSSIPSLESMAREFLEADFCWNETESWEEENNCACPEPPKAGNFLCRECTGNSQHSCDHSSRVGPAFLTPSPTILAFRLAQHVRAQLGIQKPGQCQESGCEGLQRDLMDTEDPMALAAWMRPGPSG